MVGKALRYSIRRPLQRFNIANRAKNFLGEDAKHFMPAPRAIGAVSKLGPIQYPHLEGGGSFKSLRQRRLEALQSRRQKAIESTHSHDHGLQRAFSETEKDDNLVIEASNKLEVVKTVKLVTSQQPNAPDKELTKTTDRPLPKLTNLPLQNLSSIWNIDKTPPGRLSLNSIQEMMLNKLADVDHWTPKRISETYNIKEEYAESLLKYLKQVRIIISPAMAKNLDYIDRNNPTYQATKHIVYYVDKSLRSEQDRQYDKMYLPTDEIDPEIRELLEVDSLKDRRESEEKIRKLFKRPEPLRIGPLNVGVKQEESSQIEAQQENKRQLSELSVEDSNNQKDGNKIT